MNWLTRIFHRRRLYNDLAEEMRQHLDEKTELFTRAGLPPKEADQAARRAFGNPTLLEQRGRETWQWPTVESLWSDIKYALRQLRKSPGFTLIAVLLLGLGIGATTAVFSLVDTVLLKPIPYRDPTRLVIPWNVPPAGVNIGGYQEFPWDPIRFHAMQQKTRIFQYLGAFQSGNFNLSGAGEPALLEGLRVTWGFFPALGVSPALGRVFAPEEDQPGHEHEVLLSDSVWRERFHADRGITGHIIDLNGKPYTVIGVMPPGFAFPRANEMPGDFDFPREAEIWVPAALPAVTPRFTPSELAVIGRLQPGVSIEQAQSAMNLFSAEMDRLVQVKGWYQSRVTPLQRQVAGDTRRPLMLMLAAVAVVLLIGCFNIAGLLLTRSIARQREFTLRAALGAGRARVLRQLLTESILLAVMGGAAGICIAIAGVWLVRTFGPSSIPRLQEAAPDLRVFAFTLTVTLLTGILCGLVPAFGAARINLVESLKEGGQKSGSGPSNPRLRNALVSSQIALAFALIVAAGLLIRSFYSLLAADGGFHSEHILTFEVSLPSTLYQDKQSIARFYQQALPALRAVPGVASAAVTEAVPMGGAPEATIIGLPDHPPVHNPNERPFVNYTIISPEFFSTLGTPVKWGREFFDSDTATSRPVAVINQAMAERYWPNQDPIGRQIVVPAQKVPMIIVGIVGNIKHSSLREHADPEMFVPYTQDVWPSMSIMQIVLRARSAPESVIEGARAALRGLDPSLPLAKVTTLTALTRTTMSQDRFSMLLLDFFGFLSLLLAAVGVYGVISYSVGQRTREIGIRIAVGARRQDVFRMVLGHGLRLAAVGIGVGLFAAFGVSRMLAGYLYGVKATDPLTFAAVTLSLSIIACLAGLLPARRAAAIDPIQALRAE